MCYFVIVELREPPPSLPEGLYFSANHYPELRAADPTHHLYAVADEQCSCGIYNGGVRTEEGLVARYRKQGWSGTKIERVLKDHSKFIQRGKW